MKNYFFLFILIVSFPTTSFGDQFSVQIFDVSGLPISGDFSRKTEVQPHNGRTDGVRIELDYIQGEEKGFLLGVGFAHDEVTYVDCPEVGPCPRYRTEMRYPSLSAGYHWTNKNLRTSSFLRIGYGTLKFQDDPGNIPTHSDNAFVADLGGLLSYVPKVGNVGIPLTLGIGVLNRFPSKFSYDGADFKTSDFTRLIYTRIGIGIQF